MMRALPLVTVPLVTVPFVTAKDLLWFVYLYPFRAIASGMPRSAL